MGRQTTGVRLLSKVRSGVLSALVTCAALSTAMSCAPRVVQSPSAAAPSAAKVARSGVLITYKSGRELWREEYQDDGETLVSRLQLGDRSGMVRISRSARVVVVEDGPHRVEREIPNGTIALENGNWQAYAIAAESYAHSPQPTAVQVLVPGQGAVVEGVIAVVELPERRRKVELSMQGLVVTVVLDGDGRVIEANIPAQGIAVRPLGSQGPTDTKASTSSDRVPANVALRSLEVRHEGGTLSGELWLPKGAAAPMPLVVIIPGSGPTDRDGNSALELRTDTYKQIAAAMAGRGVATLRYDKRGVARSRGYEEPSITLTSSAGDVAALVREARNQSGFSSLTLVGHSEGGIIALQSTDLLGATGLVLLAVPGRPLAAVLREQLPKRGVPVDEVDKALLALRNGENVSSPHPAIQAIFRPSVVPFLRSLLDVDPAAALRGKTVPVTIVQGDNDRQISVADAELLHAARPDARVMIIPRMSHVLKEDASDQVPQRSYVDASLPSATPIIDAIAHAVRR